MQSPHIIQSVMTSRSTPGTQVSQGEGRLGKGQGPTEGLPMLGLAVVHEIPNIKLLLLCLAKTVPYNEWNRGIAVQPAPPCAAHDQGKFTSTNKFVFGVCNKQEECCRYTCYKEMK